MILKVVATDGFDAEAVEKVQRHKDIELKVLKGVEPSQLVATLAEADLVVIRSATQMNAGVLRSLPKLKGVIRAGVGIDNVDLKAAEDLGVMVWNAPTGNFQSTAELALAHIFNCARRVAFATEGARQGKWLKKEIGGGGRQLFASVLGIYGAGNIGSRLAAMATGLGMKVQICDPIYKDGEYKKVEFAELLETSDFISIHAPLLQATKHVFNYDAFKRMKPSAYIVNCARGGIIHEADLVKALSENLIAGAGLDVFEKEPFDPKDPVYAALLADARVGITPHVGASTLEAQRFVGLETADKMIAISDALNKKSLASFPAALNKVQSPRFNLV